MNPDRDDFSFAISSTFEEVADVAERAAALCAERSAMESGLADSLRLCLAEALNNVVEHAYRGEGGNPIDVELSLGADGFAVRMTDLGTAMPDLTAPEGRPIADGLALEDLPEGGFGWMLIRSEVDRLDYRRCGDRNILELEKTCHG